MYEKRTLRPDTVDYLMREFVDEGICPNTREECPGAKALSRIAFGVKNRRFDPEIGYADGNNAAEVRVYQEKVLCSLRACNAGCALRGIRIA